MSNTLPPVEFEEDPIDPRRIRFSGSEPTSDYFKRLRESIKTQEENFDYIKNRINSKSLNAEEIYGKIGEAIQKSPIKEKDKTKPQKPVKTLFPRPQMSPTEAWAPRIDTIPVDDKRQIEIRTNPQVRGNVELVATEKKTEFPERSRWSSPDEPPPVPVERKYDLGSLTLNENGHVSMVKGTYQGAKEGITERLMMEAAKRDMTPHSSILLDPGSNMVGRFKKQYEELAKEKYLQKIQDFLTTGKTGKIWNVAAPYIGPAGTALTAGAILSAPNPVEAAILEGMSNVIPGGVSELGVSDEQKELDRQYFKRIRQSSQRQGK